MEVALNEDDELSTIAGSSCWIVLAAMEVALNEDDEWKRPGYQ